MKRLFQELEKFGSRPGLESIAKIMSALENPEKKLKVILVTGTNGKGSVVSYISSILKEAGYKTGAYFSPHLIEYNERFLINGKKISDAALGKYEKIILRLFKKGFEMTEFEALTAVAYKYFADENCDFAVMEIGMGGRLDATNIADECISIITNVDLEHTEYLGRTIEEITFEKAGIMKKGTVITGTHGKALELIKKVSEDRGLALKTINESIFAKPSEVNSSRNKFKYIGYGYYNDLEIKLIGRHQIDNAALAIAAAEELGIEEDSIRAGLKKTQNPGRLQIIQKNPLVVVDGAHNPHGIKELIANLNIFDYDKVIAVFGVMKDKDYQSMLKLLGQHCDLIIVTESKKDRSASSENLKKAAEKYVKTIAETNVKKAFLIAKKNAKKKDLILVCGSLYLIGELMSGTVRLK